MKPDPSPEMTHTVTLWCPECDRERPHRVIGGLAECQVCREPHEVNPVTLEPI